MSENANTNKKPGIKVAIVIAALALIYIVMSIFFNSHFFINSTVNGIPSSMKSAKGVYSTIQKTAKEYSVSFVFSDGTVEDTVSSDSLGFDVDYDESDVKALLDDQNGFLWIANIFKKNEYVTEKGNTYDDAMVTEIAENLKFSFENNTSESENAYITYDKDEKQFVIVDEVYGNVIDRDGVKNALINAIENFDYEINLDDGDCYVQPKIKASSKKLKRALNKVNGYLNTTITYDLEVTTEVADSDTKATWFTIDGTKVSFDEEAIGEFVDEMAEKYNTYGKAKDFVTTSGEEITVPCGTLGWKIDHDGEIAQIEADLAGGENVTRDFVYLYTAASHGENDYGDSYVEVNLTEQHVYIYKDGEMVYDTSCVTGNVMIGNDTHTGAYAIAYKETDATLKGDNYTSFVNYWMPFHNGEGLHDATWRSSFGGTIYQGNGSHGCVNLPLSAAKKIYEIVDKGWPVLVYYTGDTEAEIEAVRGPYMAVIKLIDAIGDEVTADSATAIAEARAAYDALDDEKKAMVSNYAELEAAETTLRNIQLGIVQ